MKWFIGAICALLLGVIALEWKVMLVDIPSPTIEVHARTQLPEVAELEEAKYFEFPPREEFQEAFDRPLFSATRRPPEEVDDPMDEVKGQEAASGPFPQHIQLRAIWSVGGVEKAMFFDAKEKNTVNLEEGADLESWRLDKINEDGVTLVRNGNTERIELRTFKVPAILADAKNRKAPLPPKNPLARVPVKKSPSPKKSPIWRNK